MTFEYKDGDKVVDMLPSSARRTQGRVYTVVNSYDGHSGCGPQEWCRTPDDEGVVSGVDPARYMPYTGFDAEAALKAAFAAYKSVNETLRGLGRSPINAPLVAELTFILGELRTTIASLAQPGAVGQVVINEVQESYGPEDAIYEVRIDTVPVGYFVIRGTNTLAEGHRYYFISVGKTIPIIDDWHHAKAHITQEIGYLSQQFPTRTMWAACLPTPSRDDITAAFAALDAEAA